LNLLSAATYHRAFDAPLTSDVEGAARRFSDWVKTSASADALAADGAEAVADAMRYPGAVATSIALANFAWEEAASVAAALGDRLPYPQGHLPAGGRQRHVYGAGPVDDGARKARRDDRHLQQCELRNPQHRTREGRRAKSRGQGSSRRICGGEICAARLTISATSGSKIKVGAQSG
jgi:hypothetical protein